jgi:RNA 3'-terminal phosphate cyclase
MYLDAEIEASVDDVAPMATKLGAVGSASEREGAQQCATRALQAVADGGEAGDHGLNDDLILVVAVTGQNDGTIAANMFTHDTDLSKRGAAAFARRRRSCF